MDLKSEYIWWIILLDVLSSLYVTIVLILVLASCRSPDLTAIIQPLFPLSLSAALFVSGIDLYDEWKECPETRKSTVIASILGILFEVPAYLICYQYAFES